MVWLVNQSKTIGEEGIQNLFVMGYDPDQPCWEDVALRNDMLEFS